MPFSSSGMATEQQQQHPVSTPAGTAAGRLPPAANAAIAKMRMAMQNNFTKEWSRQEKEFKARLASIFPSLQNGDAFANDEKSPQEVDLLRQELEEKNRKIAELEEKLRNAADTIAPAGGRSPSKTLESSPKRKRTEDEKPPSPTAAAAVITKDFGAGNAEDTRTAEEVQESNEAFKRQMERLKTEHTTMRVKKRKEINELKKALKKAEQSAEIYMNKHQHEKRRRQTWEEQFNTLEKDREVIGYCVKRVKKRMQAEDKKWDDWTAHYKDIQTRTFGLIDAVRDGDLHDLELNSLEELLRKSPPDRHTFSEFDNILKRMDGKGSEIPSSKEIKTENESENENEGPKDKAPAAARAGQSPVEANEQTGIAENIENGEMPPSPLIPPEDEDMPNLYDSDPDRTTDESEPEMDRFSPISRAMARGPGPETLEAFFPPLPPSSPALTRPARSLRKRMVGGKATQASPPPPVPPDPIPIKLESDSSEHNEIHANHEKLGYYQFSREGGDTLDVDEHLHLSNTSEPIVPSSPNAARISTPISARQEPVADEEHAAGATEEQEQENDVPANEQPDLAPDPATEETPALKKPKTRRFGQPIVNSVRLNSTQIKEVDEDEPNMITPKPLKTTTKQCPHTAPQPATKVAPKETPALAKRKRQVKAQSTVKKKRKVVGGAEIEAMTEDGTHLEKLGRAKRDKGQLARLLQTPDISQDIILTPPSLKEQAAGPEAAAEEEVPTSSSRGSDNEPSTPKNMRTRSTHDVPSDIVSPSAFVVDKEKNNGVGYAYHEGARTKESKQCLPTCVKECCSGFANGKMLEMWPMPEPVNKPLKFRSTPEKPKQDASTFMKKATTAKKGVSARKEEWEKDANRREANATYLKHRSNYSKQAEPLNFFNADFPTTQEIEEQRRDAERRRTEKGWERERDSNRGGIWKRK